MNGVDRYLNEVCWAMGGSLAEQQAVRDELRAHILEGARDFELQGVSSADALPRALRDLGDAEAVGRAMRRSRRTVALRRPMPQPEGALLLRRHREVHVPSGGVLFVLTACAAMSALVTFSYLWPG